MWSLATWIVLGTIGLPGPSPAQTFADSPHAVPVTLPGCDPADPEVRIIDSVEDWAVVNDPAARVFCVRPGRYGSAGIVTLERSGEPGRPRVLRYEDPLGLQPPHPIRQDVERVAIVRGLELRDVGHWVIDGLVIRRGRIGVWLRNADHVVLNRLVIQDVERNAVRFDESASYNVVQNSVLRRTPISSDSSCVAFQSPEQGREQRGNRVVQNEIADCGDGVMLNLQSDRATGGHFPGLVIDGNDVYLTSRRYTDCKGHRDPDGACACAENGIDVKIAGTGPGTDERVTISDNRIWGYRPTDDVASAPGGLCEAMGADGTLVTIARDAHHVVVRGNRLLDGPEGIVTGAPVADVSVEDNLLYRIGEVGIAVGIGSRDTSVHRNVIVESGRWLGLLNDHAERARATCNVLVRSHGGGGKEATPDSVFDQNTYVESPPGRLVGPNDRVFADVASVGSGPVCFWRRRWTTPERVCVPYGTTEPAAALADACGGTRAVPAAPRMIDG